MIKIPDYILKVLNILYDNGFEGYLVGGCVRDALMGKDPHDFDITTNALPEEIIKCFSGMRIIETGLKHGTVTVVSEGENVEITTYRIDGKYTDNRHPEKVLFTRNIHEDLSRRDFTVNAIAYSPKDGIVDIFSGREDISSSLIKCVGCPDTRFGEDGLRIMRALRFASVLSFDIDPLTCKSIHINKNLLKNISAERIFAELKKLVCGKNAEQILGEFYDVFCVVFPSLAKYEDKYFENIKKLTELPCDNVIRFSALFYGVDEEDIKKSLKSLKPDNNFYSNVTSLLNNVCEDIKTDEISVRYLMNKMSDENIIRLSQLKGLFSKNFCSEDFLKEYHNQLNNGACVKIKDLLVSGSDIIALGVEKGPEIGEIMDTLLKAVIENKCSNEKSELIRYALDLI